MNVLKQVTVWVKHPERVTLGAIQGRLATDRVRVVGNPRREDKEMGEAFVFDADLLLKDVSAVAAIVEGAETENGVAASVAVEYRQPMSGDHDNGELSEGRVAGFELTAFVVSSEQAEFLSRLVGTVAALGEGKENTE